MIRPWVKIVVAFSAVFVIGTVAFRSWSRTGSSTAGSQVAPHGSERGAKEGAGWIAKPNDAAESQSGDDVRVPQGAPGGLREGGAKGPRAVPPGSAAVGPAGPGATSSKEPATGTTVQVDASIPAATFPSGKGNPLSSDEGSGTGAITNTPPPEGSTTNDGRTSSDNPTPPDERSNPPPTLPGIAMVGGKDFEIDSESVFPSGIHISGDEGTISFCVQPQWTGEEAADASFVSTPDAASNGLQIAKNGDRLRFTLADSNGVETAAAASITSWKPGERHLITATWGGERTLLYVDGQLVDQQTYQGQLDVTPDTPLRVGSRSAGDIPGARGSLSNLQVYNRPLQEGEVPTLTTGCR